MNLRRPHIVIVDDEVAMVRSLEMLLRSEGEISKVYSVPEALEVFEKGSKIDCIVTDVTMPEASGIHLLEWVRRHHADVPVIVMTAFSSVPQAVEAMQKGAFEYIVKPFDNEDLLETVRRALKRRGLSMGETRQMPEGWVCNSAAMQDFVSRAQKAAVTESHLLLLGEAGAGKGRAARWIHDLSAFAKKDFVSVDGRSHEDDSPLIQGPLPKSGSLFVAEVFSLGSRSQDRLMEVMREQKVRVIAASSSSPEYQSLPGFREDLFRELTKVSLKVPSLRDRKEDLEGLCRQILASVAQKLRMKQLELHSSALTKLRDSVLPSNVRGLEHLLERSALESKAGVITENDLSFDNKELTSQLPFAIPVEDGWVRMELLVENLERDLILRALEKFPDRSNTQIAQILGTTRRILELRMKHYHIREGA
jgi:DNA-binding NtrC family response regulator